MGKVEEQEEWLDRFMEHETYDNATEAIYQLVKTAFEAGWEKGEMYAKHPEA